MYSPFKYYNRKPNFNVYSDIKGLRFFTKEISPYYCRFLHTQINSGGASIHRQQIVSPEAIFRPLFIVSFKSNIVISDSNSILTMKADDSSGQCG